MNDIMSDILARLTSRKFLVVVGLVLAIIFRDALLLGADELMTIKQVLIAYLLAEGTVDAVGRYKEAQ